jgi:hypothetical protein
MQFVEARVEAPVQAPVRSRTRFSPAGMSAVIAAVLVCSMSYHVAGVLWFASTLSLRTHLAFSAMLAFAVVGVYQVYFWVQQNDHFVRRHSLRTTLDSAIPFVPQSVWVYGVLYYVMIGFVIATMKSVDEGLAMVFGALVLMGAQVICFLVFPVHTPAEYRQYPVKSISGRFLSFMQRFDGAGNCFPSNHCSIAMYVSLLLLPHLGPASFLFAAGIALSSLLCKQQFLLDVPAGLFLGWAAWKFTAVNLLS